MHDGASKTKAEAILRKYKWGPTFIVGETPEPDAKSASGLRITAASKLRLITLIYLNVSKGTIRTTGEDVLRRG